MGAVNAAVSHSLVRPQSSGRTLLTGLLSLVVSLGLGGIGSTCAAAGKIPCSPCHDQLQASWSGSPHERAGRQLPQGFRCQECHTGGLLHPTAVTPANSVERCGRCHFASEVSPGKKTAVRPQATLNREAWQGSRHNQAGVACTACHSVHHYAEGADQHLLRQAGDALCRSCHPQPKHAQAAKTLGAESVAKQPCVACHNPHGGETALLENLSGGTKGDFRGKSVHRPIAEKKCNDCHSAHIMGFGSTPPEELELDEEADGQSAGPAAYKGLLLAPGRTFCYLCHGGFKEKFEASGHAKIVRFRRGEEQSPCLGCHLPHASKFPKLTRYEGNQLCLSCHPGYAPHHFLARGGVKQSRLQCVKCHNPHGSGNRRLLVQADVCKMCHKM
ncbi:MAG TPA: hypothetical protein GXX28_04415 [Firmicutes bacterium]|nr:hypothetical protein [Bacillota bacterium]